jgi:LuxR family maltose regulon positive regulatory protein
LHTLLPETDQCNRFYLETLCLQAILFDLTHRPKDAIDTLQSLLEMAEPQGYLRLFVDEGEKMQPLLTRILPTLREHPALAVYVSKMLAVFSTAFTPDHKPTQEGLIEPLTDRELEVLNYIAQGLSNPEIAKRLYLSPNTLKAHAQNIFSKLNVHNRVEATNRARELRLVG